MTRPPPPPPSPLIRPGKRTPLLPVPLSAPRPGLRRPTVARPRPPRSGVRTPLVSTPTLSPDQSAGSLSPPLRRPRRTHIPRRHALLAPQPRPVRHTVPPSATLISVPFAGRLPVSSATDALKLHGRLPPGLLAGVPPFPQPRRTLPQLAQPLTPPLHAHGPLTTPGSTSRASPGPMPTQEDTPAPPLRCLTPATLTTVRTVWLLEGTDVLAPENHSRKFPHGPNKC